MTTMSKMVDLSSQGGLDFILQHTQKDDIVFLALIFLTGIFYTFFFKDKPDPYHYVWFEKPQATDASSKGADTRDIGQKLEETNKDIVIFWGSQSGTAEGLANRLVRDCRSRFGLDALAADLSDYDPESIANISEAKFAVFIVSTYGEGDPSDNATQFLSWLDSNKTIQFPKLRYAAFGLGNKKYKFYNRVVDVVVDALDRFGAKPLMPTGKADDSNGMTDEDFTEWKQLLFSLFRNDLEIEERPEIYEPTLRVVEDTSLDVIDLHVGEPIQARGKKSTAAPSIQPLPVNSAKKVLSTIDRNCLHVELNINEFPELKYKTGDHLAVWPSNPTSEVERLARILGLQNRMHKPLLISSLESSVKVKVPSPTTWSALLEHYLEICAPVPREIVLSLAQFAPSASAKATLQSLGQDKDVYHSYCAENHITLGRLLENVSVPTDSWSNLPLSFILESLSSLSPRYYSISSSSIVSPKQISITVATSTSPSPGRTIPIPSLTTNYLLAIEQNKPHAGRASDLMVPAYNLSGPNNILNNGAKLFAQIRHSKFRLPVSPKNPIIMIAAGSGVAPFRAFLYERARISTIGREVGSSLLFFGCRSPADFLYKDELSPLVTRHSEMEVVTAFSRTEKGKSYVQDKVEEREEGVTRLLTEENAYFYICGSAGMARDVAGRLGECLKRRKGWGEEELREWSEGMKRGRRWQEDVWG